MTGSGLQSSKRGAWVDQDALGPYGQGQLFTQRPRDLNQWEIQDSHIPTASDTLAPGGGLMGLPVVQIINYRHPLREASGFQVVHACTLTVL